MDGSREAKVCNFELVVFIEHEILRFKVAMADASLVHVLKSLKHLKGVEPGNWLAKLTSERDEIEQFTTAAKFKNDVLDFFRPLLRVLLNA